MQGLSYIDEKGKKRVQKYPRNKKYISNTEDVIKLNKKLTSVNNQNQQILHLKAEHATVVNETLWEVKRTAETLKLLAREVNNLGAKIMQRYSTDFAKLVQCVQFLDQLHAAVAWYEEYVNNLGLGITSLAQG